jgi:small subunit ribosomal protein S1
MDKQEYAVLEKTEEVEIEEEALSTLPEVSSDAANAGEEPPSESSQSPDVSSTIESDGSTEESFAEEPDSSEEPDGPLSDDVSIHSLKPGQHFVGKVKNITDFGAFVDIGIPQDGLVHISKLSRRKVDKVTDVVSEGQEIDVWVKKVDKKRGRISLTMIKPIRRRLKNIKEDDEFEGTVTRLEPYGAFVDIDSDRDGLVHISQITHDYIKHPEESLSVGDKVKVKVLKVNRKKRQVDLSIKALLPPPVSPVEEKVVQVVEHPKEPEFVAEPEASLPTAMALAYAAFQDGDQTDKLEKDSDTPKSKEKQKQEMDAIVARTLATRED